MIILFTICFLCFLWRLLRRNDTGPPKLSRKLPLIGHGHLFLGGSVGIWKTLKGMSEETLEKGGLTRCYIGFRTVYVLTDPEDSLTVSNACLEKDYYYNFGKPILGNGLLVANVPTWKKHRRLLHSAFNQLVLNSFMGVFNSQARRLVDQFAPQVGKPFDHEGLLRQVNLETICITAIGVTADELIGLQKQYLPRFGEFLEIVTERFQKVWLHSDFIYNLSNLKRQQDVTVKNFLALSKSIIQQKKMEFNAKLMAGEQDNDQGKLKPFMDLILQLVKETNCFTDEEIRAETDGIIAGGHDTTAAHLTFVLVILGSYPEIQKKLYEEVVQVAGLDKDVDKDDLSKLVYTDAVLKETMRLYPIVPVMARYIDREIKLRKYTLKAGSGCVILANGLHRHAIWGPDANEFKPERWLDTATLPDMSYFAGFGLGRRFCIGKIYAMMSMKTTIAHVVRRYKIKSDISKLRLKLSVMLKPENGHHISLELRK